MTTITDWLMVSITLVYVGATVFICIYNSRSAKATREQVGEIKRQFDESNRAYITYEFLFVKHSFYGIRFTNNGKRVANHVKIEFKQEFIDSITKIPFLNLLNGFKDKEFVLGVGQSYDIYIGSTEYLKNQQKKPIAGKIVYQDNNVPYIVPFFIDLENYPSIYSVNSYDEDLLAVLKKQTKELEKIAKELRKL